VNSKEKFEVTMEDLRYWLDLAWRRAKLGKRDMRSPIAIFRILKAEFLAIAESAAESQK
jgi:hypothetical protein